MDDQVDVKFLFENNKGALTQQIYFLKNPYLKCLSFESRQYITRCALKKINK